MSREEYDLGVVERGQDLGLMSEIAHVVTSGLHGTLQYVRLEPVAPGTVYQNAGERPVEMTTITTPLRRLASMVPVSRQAWEDEAFLDGYKRRIVGFLQNYEEDFFMEALLDEAKFTKAKRFHRVMDEIAALAERVPRMSGERANVVLVPPSLMAKLLKRGQKEAFDMKIIPSPKLHGRIIALNTNAAAFARTAAPTLRVSENHDDFFMRNIVALLLEEQAAVMVMNTDAIQVTEVRSWPDDLRAVLRRFRWKVRRFVRRATPAAFWIGYAAALTAIIYALVQLVRP